MLVFKITPLRLYSVFSGGTVENRINWHYTRRSEWKCLAVPCGRAGVQQRLVVPCGRAESVSIFNKMQMLLHVLVFLK